MKKLKAALAVFAVSAFAGCSHIDFDGYAEVKRGITAFSELEAGHITVTDMESGTVVNDMVFKVDDRDYLLYNLTTTLDGKTYFEYHNGRELFYTGENGEWTLKTADEGYTGYTRKSRPRLASEQLFYLNEGAIASSELSGGDGITVVKFNYDVKKINAETSDEASAFISLVTEYTLDENGEIISHRQTAELEDSDGEYGYDYLAEIEPLSADEVVIESPLPQ